MAAGGSDGADHGAHSRRRRGTSRLLRLGEAYEAPGPRGNHYRDALACVPVREVDQVWAAPPAGRSTVEGLEVVARLPGHTHLPAPARARPPILFVHGAAHGAWSWDEHWLPAAAARGWPAYALSVRGHGDHDRRPLRRERLRDYEQDVWQVLIRLPGRAVLVGHSMGALLVNRILARYPARAGVLVAPVDLRSGLGWGARLARLHPGGYLRGLALAPPAPGPDHLFAGLDPAEAARLAARTIPESPVALLQIHGLRRPRRTAAPVLVLAGGDDATVPAGDTVRVARHHGTRAHLFRGMGHDLMLDRGWDRPLTVMLDWLERTVTGPAGT